MDDLISRQAALTAIWKLYPGAPMMTSGESYVRWKEKYGQYISAEQAIKELPSAQPPEFTNIEPLTPELKMGAEIVINALISNSDDQEKAVWKRIWKFIDDLPNGILVPVRKREEPEIIRCKDCKWFG